MKSEAHGSKERYGDRESFLVFGAPAIENNEIEEVVSCMKSGWLGTGPRAARLERLFSSYKGADHAIAVSSCTAALHLSIMAAGIGPGDEVITTPLTFCATINAIIHAGAKPVLADVDPETTNIDPCKAEECITPRTRAILPVHFAGRPCDMERLCDIAERYGLTIIEDCAHAVEAEYMGRKTGTFGDFGCFSFYATKNVTAGEGGMVIARNERDAKRVRIMALHGLSDDAWSRYGDSGFKHYCVVERGFKYNLMDIQAAIAIHQLARVEDNWKRRKEIWGTYQRAFSELPLKRPLEPQSGTRHAYHLYTICVSEEDAGIDRNIFIDEMTRRGVGVGVHYLSIPEHPYYQNEFGWVPDGFPNARDVGRQTVSLPLSPKLTDNDVGYVVDCVIDVLGAGVR